MKLHIVINNAPMLVRVTLPAVLINSEGLCGNILMSTIVMYNIYLQLLLIPSRRISQYLAQRIILE